jgi:ATP-dependent DNA helicase RecQ
MESPAELGFGSGSAVDHDEFGRGTVMTVQSDRTTVLFDEHGYKTIALSARDRLRPVPG